jgi:hypothetical protein
MLQNDEERFPAVYEEILEYLQLLHLLLQLLLALELEPEKRIDSLLLLCEDHNQEEEACHLDVRLDVLGCQLLSFVLIPFHVVLP